MWARKKRCSTILIVLITLTTQSLGWIPPAPGTDFETVQEMRKRLNITYNYTPSLIHPELCRYRTEGECQILDENFEVNGRRHRELSRKLLDPPESGTVHVLVVLIYFTDHVNKPRPPRSHFTTLFNGDIKRWFDLNSYGNYAIEPVITDWYPSDNNEAFYAAGVQGYTDTIDRAIYPALNSLDQDSSFDWSRFDANNDGFLDAVIMIHSGYGAQHSCEGYNLNNLIWSQMTSFSVNDGLWTSRDGIQLNQLVISSAYGDCETSGYVPMGLICHEYMHLFGLPDLYPLSGDPGNGAGGFDIMGYAYGPKNDAVIPGHLSMWTKNEVNWLSYNTIFGDGIYSLEPSETTADNFVIRDLYARFEYLAFENRQPIEFDAELWSSGLVIYHIDGGANGQAVGGYPGQAGWPQNGNHYEVAVLPADGQYDLEQDINQGDAGYFFQPGMELTPGYGNTVFPNTDSYQDGDIFETDITVTVLPTVGSTVRFQIGGLWPSEFPTLVPDTDDDSPTQPPPPMVPAPTSSPTTQPPVQPPPTRPPTEPATEPPIEPPTPNPTQPLPTPPPATIPTLPPSWDFSDLIIVVSAPTGTLRPGPSATDIFPISADQFTLPTPTTTPISAGFAGESPPTSTDEVADPDSVDDIDTPSSCTTSWLLPYKYLLWEILLILLLGTMELLPVVAC